MLQDANKWQFVIVPINSPQANKQLTSHRFHAALNVPNCVDVHSHVNLLTRSIYTVRLSKGM